MLTLERGRWESIYSLGGEEVHGLRPFTVHTQAEPDVRASGRMSGRRAGCPVVHEGLDVRVGGAGCPVLPEGPDARCVGRMSGLLGPSSVYSGSLGRISGASGGAGCPGHGAGCPDVRMDEQCSISHMS